MLNTVWSICNFAFKVNDLWWTQEGQFLSKSLSRHISVRTPGQLNVMINNDSPLNWSKLFQLRNRLHSANALFSIFSLQLLSFSILVFFFSLNIRFDALYSRYLLATHFNLIHPQRKWFLGKILKAWCNFDILPRLNCILRFASMSNFCKGPNRKKPDGTGILGPKIRLSM